MQDQCGHYHYRPILTSRNFFTDNELVLVIMTMIEK